MQTEYHAKYFAYDLTRAGGKGFDRISQSLFNASVDLNPHQVEAALFALRSPLSKGVLLADEVGLGKTIEAGLVLCQYWAERKRHLLVVCPQLCGNSGRSNWKRSLICRRWFLMPKRGGKCRNKGTGIPFTTAVSSFPLIITSAKWRQKYERSSGIL